MRGSTKLKKLGIGFGFAIAVFAIAYINLAIYPFQTQRPNFSDVERVFNKMQFPSDWKEIDSSENRGIAGRACPIESESRCYHISKTFHVPKQVTLEEVKRILMQTGCPAVAITDNTYKDEFEESKNFACSIEGLDIGSGFRGPEDEVYISVGT